MEEPKPRTEEYIVHQTQSTNQSFKPNYWANCCRLKSVTHGSTYKQKIKKHMNPKPSSRSTPLHYPSWSHILPLHGQPPRGHRFHVCDIALASGNPRDVVTSPPPPWVAATIVTRPHPPSISVLLVLRLLPQEE